MLVRVHFAGVNPIDWKLRAGYLKQFMPVPLPAIPGLDVSGTVEAVGEGVSGFAVGDRVFGRGASTYAEFAVAPITTTVQGRVQETRKTINGKVRGGGPMLTVRTGSGDIHIE